MTTAMPSAATRESRTITRPSGPRNSAITARNASAGGKPDFVKYAMVPLKPLPPNHPSVFCAPCGNMTAARVSLRTSGKRGGRETLPPARVRLRSLGRADAAVAAVGASRGGGTESREQDQECECDPLHHVLTSHLTN